MAKEFREVNGSVPVPKHVGVTGLLEVVKKIVGLPRVQDIHIDGRKNPLEVTFTRYAAADEPDSELGIDLDTLEPYAIIRSREIREIPDPSPNAVFAIAQLFRSLSDEGLWPVAWVGGAQSHFWAWHKRSAQFLPSRSIDDAYGLPFLMDHNLGDEALILVGAYSRTATLIDARLGLKISVPQLAQTPAIVIEVLDP